MGLGIPSSPTPSSDLNYKASIKAVRGHRPYMEDEFIVSPGSRFCGVFDGHGGSKVSQYLRDNLYSKFSSKLSRQQSLPEVVDAIKDSFKEVRRIVMRSRRSSPILPYLT